MAVKASKLGPGVFTLTSKDAAPKATDFSGQCRKVIWEPDYKTEDPIEVLSGDEYAEPGKLNSKISGEMLQDYGAASLSKFCLDNAGKVFEFEFVPSKAGKLKIAGELQVTPIGVGGDVGKTNAISFEFPVIGKPALTDDYVPA